MRQYYLCRRCTKDLRRGDTLCYPRILRMCIKVCSRSNFFKQVLIFPYRYCLCYRCYRTCQQELSCIKQFGQLCVTYHIQNSTGQGEINIMSEVSPDDSWRELKAMSVFLVFVILPPVNIQIAIFVIIWWQNGKKSTNDLSPINKSVSKVGISVITFWSSFRQSFRSLKA